MAGFAETAGTTGIAGIAETAGAVDVIGAAGTADVILLTGVAGNSRAGPRFDDPNRSLFVNASPLLSVAVDIGTISDAWWLLLRCASPSMGANHGELTAG
ncbi:MAG TPA: hypothetical protein DEP36_09870 [Gammaproteobacteria bacterium]|nr:hypothetical protein [Gammaproteobacteria bacterium]